MSDPRKKNHEWLSNSALASLTGIKAVCMNCGVPATGRKPRGPCEPSPRYLRSKGRAEEAAFMEGLDKP